MASCSVGETLPHAFKRLLALGLTQRLTRISTRGLKRDPPAIVRGEEEEWDSASIKAKGRRILQQPGTYKIRLYES
jgi:hypothetical protein